MPGASSENETAFLSLDMLFFSFRDFSYLFVTHQQREYSKISQGKIALFRDYKVIITT